MTAFTPPPLLATRRDIAVLFVAATIVLALRLAWEYRTYRAWIAKPFIVTQGYVEDAYVKRKGRYRYQVLKLRTQEGRRIVTTTRWRQPLRDRRVKLRLIPDETIGFLDYLGRFYVKSRIIRVLPTRPSLRHTLASAIARQHRDANASALYQALFIAHPLPKALRQKVAQWGISHLIALSGFHIGLIALILYAILRLPYRRWQARYAPHRLETLDLGITVVALAGAYVWLTGAPEALVRAYAMMIAGIAALVVGVEVVDFTLLALIVAVLIAVQPAFAVSLGFWFSVTGVGYIFLLLRYFHRWPKFWLGFVVIPVGVFVLMLPLTHAFFDVTTLQQFTSPILSVAFTLFYPLSALAHFIGYGDLFDKWLSILWQTPVKSVSVLVPHLLWVSYAAMSLLAVRYKWAFYALLGVASGFAIYLLWMLS